MRDKEKNKLRQRKWRSVSTALSNTREYANASRREQCARAKQRAHTVLGDCCKNCGNTDHRILEIDHIHNDGKQDRNIGKPGLCKRVLKNPEHFQLLCANCHAIRHYDLQHTSISDPDEDIFLRKVL